MTEPSANETRAIRTDIEALRALAVTLVLVFHAFPNALPGGFVGVDVFFVISGYLILGHLVGTATSGRVDLVRFWVRRAWRLLPMAYLVLATTLVATLVFAPRAIWASTTREVAASTLYVQNWHLFAQSSDYTAADTDASPVQHYWSLSIEEQLYVAAPLVMLALLFLVGATRVRRSAVWLLLGVTALSYGYSVGWEPAIAAQAYFSSLTRVWEFTIGGVIAVAGVRFRGHWAGAAFWGGILVTVLVAVVLQDVEGFPGWVALVPVAGTVAALAGGEGLRLGRRLVEVRPVQRLGGLSYSVYLWHWPILVLAPHALGHELSSAEAVGALAGAILLALVSHPVERRLRALGRGGLGGQPLLRTVAPVVVAGLVLIAGGQAVQRSLPDSTDTAASVDKAKRTIGSCFGAPAMLDSACDVTPKDVVPDLSTVSGNNPEERCKESLTGTEVLTCTFGPEDGTPVALAGDSHAQRLLPALKPLAAERGWRITTYLKASCPFTAARPIKYESSCVAWNDKVMDELRSDPPKVLITMSAAGLQYHKEPGTTDVQAGATGLSAHAKDLSKLDVDVIAVVDNPQPGFAGIDPPACVQREGPTGCTFPADSALRADSAKLAAKADTDIGLLDLTDLFCKDGTCRSAIGGILVYRDGQHVIDIYARSMAPVLAERLTKLSSRLA